MMKRPSDARLLAMVQYIRSLGLDVTGSAVDLRRNELLPGSCDYTPRMVVAYRKRHEAKAFTRLNAHDYLKRERAMAPPMSDDEIEARIIDGTIAIGPGDDLWGRYKHLVPKFKGDQNK